MLFYDSVVGRILLKRYISQIFALIILSLILDVDYLDELGILVMSDSSSSFRSFARSVPVSMS